MSKHTPGTWSVDGPSLSFYMLHPDPENGYGITIRHGNSGTIAHLTCVESEKIERTANARLIAAAPEMLEALQAFVGAWPTIKGGTLNGDVVCDLARAAIAKATGETP